MSRVISRVIGVLFSICRNLIVGVLLLIMFVIVRVFKLVFIKISSIGSIRMVMIVVNLGSLVLLMIVLVLKKVFDKGILNFLLVYRLNR